MNSQIIVKSGHKQTEIGTIPEDWMLKTFKDVCWVNQGLQINISERRKNPSPKSKKYITIQYLKDGKDTEYIEEYSNSVCCEKEDILMTRTGNTGIVISNVEGVFHNNFFKINYDKKMINRRYLIYFLNQKKIQNIILNKAGTSTIPDLNHSDFYSIPITYPKELKEQTMIAKVIHDTDKLIMYVNKQIKKQNNIKEGAMQELLTGKKQLSGFNGKWSEKTFEELFTFLITGTNSRSDLSSIGDIGYIHYGDIHTEWKQFLDCDKEEIPKISKEKVSNLPRLREGDLILADASEDYSGIGACILLKNIKNKKIVSGLHTILLRYNETKISSNYSIYITSIRDVKEKLINISTGISVYGLSKNQLKKVKVYLPEETKEQSAIAEILYEMNLEINELETKRDKYIMIKNGMMQKLLTGEIRLV